MRDVYLIGSGQTPVSRGATAALTQSGAVAIHQALTDAELGPDEVDALFVGNMASGILSSQLQLGSLLADYAAMNGIEAVTIEAACASGSAAARMGYLTIAGGIHDIVVVCGVEQLAHVERDSATRALATAADWDLEGRAGETFITLNAQLMRAYIERYGARPEDFAPFAIAAHANACRNPNALFHKHIDLQAYLDSRVVHGPLRLYDVSPICDGSAAIVLASETAMKVVRDSRRPRVKVAASSIATAPIALERRRDILRLEAVESATRQSLQQAGLTHRDIDLVELHDAYTIMTVLSLEAAGFAAAGRGPTLAHDGRIDAGGELPISTFGGLKARGHPVGATGVYQLAEAYLQLTDRAGDNQVADARTALVQNIGGTASTVVNHILQRVD